MFITVLREGGPFVLLQVAAAGGALAVTLVVGALQIARIKAPPALVALALAAIPAACVIGSSVGTTMAFDSIAHASAEMKQTLLAAGVSVGLFNHVAVGWMLAVPAGLAILLGAIGGPLRAPRRFGLPIAAAVLALVTAASALGAGVMIQVTGMAAVRSGIYLVFGLLTAVALMGDEPKSAKAQPADEDDPTVEEGAEPGSEDTEEAAGGLASAGPYAGALAAMAFPLLVGGMEVSAIASQQLQIFEAVAHASGEMKGTLMMQGMMLVDQGRVFVWLAIGASSAVAFLGAFGATREPRFAAGVLPGLVAPLLIAAAMWTDANFMLHVLQVMFR